MGTDPRRGRLWVRIAGKPRRSIQRGGKLPKKCHSPPRRIAPGETITREMPKDYPLSPENHFSGILAGGGFSLAGEEVLLIPAKKLWVEMR
jgi:hypothetical protein